MACLGNWRKSKRFSCPPQVRQGLHRQGKDHRRSATGHDRAEAVRGEIPLLPLRQKEDYNLDPLRFFENNGGLYIFAYITEYKEIRTLAVNGIATAAGDRQFLRIPRKLRSREIAQLGLRHHLRQAHTGENPVLQGSSPLYQGANLGTQSRITENEADSSIILEMETSGWLDVKRWAMAYGMHAEVWNQGNEGRNSGGIEELPCQYSSA